MRQHRHWKFMVFATIVLVGSLPLQAARVMAGEDSSSLTEKLKALGKKKREKTLKLIKDNKDALVIVQFVISIKASRNGQQFPAQEKKVRLAAVTLNDKGLTLASNIGSDPLAGRQIPPNMQVETNVLNVKIILNDGSEVPAKVAMRDKDLDVILVQPEKVEAGKKYPFITLDAAAKPTLLEPVMGISRLGFDTNRTPVVLPGAIRGIIKKPRNFYFTGINGTGLPVFNKDGKCFGIMLRRMGESGPTGPALALPAEDILEIVKQVK